MNKETMSKLLQDQRELKAEIAELRKTNLDADFYELDCYEVLLPDAKELLAQWCEHNTEEWPTLLQRTQAFLGAQT